MEIHLQPEIHGDGVGVLHAQIIGRAGHQRRRAGRAQNGNAAGRVANQERIRWTRANGRGVLVEPDIQVRGGKEQQIGGVIGIRRHRHRIIGKAVRRNRIRRRHAVGQVGVKVEIHFEHVSGVGAVGVLNGDIIGRAGHQRRRAVGAQDENAIGRVADQERIRRRQAHRRPWSD